MGMYLADGTRVTKSTVSKSAETDPIVVLGTDLYQTAPYGSGDTPGVNADPSSRGGSKFTLFARAGQTIRQSALNALFPQATITNVTPAAGPAAGGTQVTLTGTDLDGATAVTFGGVAATGVTVVDQNTLKATTGAHAAGVVDIAVTDDGGTVTVTGGFTYQ